MIEQFIDETSTDILRAILIDDEMSSLRSLDAELSMYCPEIKVIGKFQDPAKASSELDSLNPDVVFLDIEMPGMNGFEFLQQFENIPFNVIFVTAYDEFAIRAFDFNAVDYVLKPVRKAKLIQAVQRAQENQSRGIDQSHLEALIQNISVQYSPPGLRKIALPTSEGYSMVHIDDIIYLNAESNYTWVFISNSNKYLVSKTLKEFAEILDFPQFFRPHKSYLVNLNHVDRYVRGQGGYLIMKDGEQVPVARAQKSDLMRALRV